MQATGLTRGFCELTLEARDPEALAGFYRSVFGWAELSKQHDRIWLACGDRSRLGLWTRGRKEPRGGRSVRSNERRRLKRVHWQPKLVL